MKELLNKIHLIDCMDLMAKLPDKSIDLAIVDPPYFEEYGKEIYPGAAISTTGIKRNRFESKHWDVPKEDYFLELKRVSKNQIIWGFNYYEIKNFGTGRIIWDKVNDKSSFSKAEIAYCSLHKSVQMFRFMWNGMLQGDMKNKEIRIHPTQKPIPLYRWTLQKYAKEGDIILDTHCGSGALPIACIEEKFQYIACEIGKDYHKASLERIQLYLDQGKLFK
jgi:site-specific DNA-methyltransferase (adenine-specific)